MTKDEMKNRISMSLKDPILQQGFEFICKNLLELEKENAELRKKKLSLQDAVDMQMYTNKANKEIADMQLTKAKELLKWFVWYFSEGSSNLVPYKHKVKEAEQFLNNEVEKTRKRNRLRDNYDGRKKS